MTHAVDFVAPIAAVVGMLALLAVFIFWGASNSSAALPYFAVPGALFGLSAVLGYRAWAHRNGRDRRTRRSAD